MKSHVHYRLLMNVLSRVTSLSVSHKQHICSEYVKDLESLTDPQKGDTSDTSPFTAPYGLIDFLLEILGYYPNRRIYHSFCSHVEGQMSQHMFNTRMDCWGFTYEQRNEDTKGTLLHTSTFNLYNPNEHFTELKSLYTSWLNPATQKLLEECLKPNLEAGTPFTIIQFMEAQIGFRPASGVVNSFHSTLDRYYGAVKSAMQLESYPAVFERSYWDPFLVLYKEWYEERGEAKIREHHDCLSCKA